MSVSMGQNKIFAWLLLLAFEKTDSTYYCCFLHQMQNNITRPSPNHHDCGHFM
jgi:hypothetical protein